MEESVVGRPYAWDPATLREEDWLIQLPYFRPDMRPSGQAVLPPDLTARLLAALREGPGLAVLRGLRLDGLSDQDCAGLGQEIVSLAGTPRPHESAAPQDHLLGAARPPGAPVPVDRTNVPGSGPEEPVLAPREPALAPHTDRAGPPGPPRLLALLCVRPAPTGGESFLISGSTVHDRLAATRPGELPLLYGDFHFGTEPGLARTGPVFARCDDRLTVHYNRHQIERGHRAAGDPLGTDRTRALDAFDALLADASLLLRVSLRRGDLLLLDNTSVLHGRTAFTDHPDPLRQRCLTRAWAD
ncbi:TauD/TfdA family dioxygenase [Streptomyces sp. NBC_00237]|uniref:TauD/TfdA family dioxygenase n=1 Tax=Streptomyces sp. NBC_00237 TaxID=2975687 RepID=UPI00225690DE|nr:TauD/TfdA family dioxygenase [Streptomyces sp. NBC_00237]MCX5202754.1 TauD/TfdA family dioxygenase [Streptomyces sp. NBC_00237]